MAKTKNLDPAIGEKISQWRQSMMLSRLDLSRELNVSKTSVSNWELGLNEPSGEIYARLALLAQPPERWWFLERAGLLQSQVNKLLLDKPHGGTSPKKMPMAYGGSAPRARLNARSINSGTIQIPLMRDAVAAGAGRPIDEQIEKYIDLPREWFPFKGKLRALRVNGTSMHPLLADGIVIVIDTAQQRKEELIGKVVVARFEDEVTVKRLLCADGVYLLAPENSDFRPLVVKSADGWAIIGKVIRWFGDYEAGRVREEEIS